MAGLASAWRLSERGWQDELESITVYQRGWRLRGKTWPHPFFKRETREPIYPLTVLSPGEREALRPLCGPRPAPA